MADDTQAGFVSPAPQAGCGQVIAAVAGFPAPIGPVDLTLRIGDIVHVRGGNGSGKTSLLRALAGLDAPVRPRTATVLQRDPREMGAPGLAKSVRAVWSSPRASLVGLTVAGEARLRGTALPEDLGPWSDRDVATLSAGEASKVALAFVAASRAPLLLLDEPVAALDGAGRSRVESLVRSAAATGAVAIADHSGWAATVANRTLDLAPPTPSIDLVLPRVEAKATLLAAPAHEARFGKTAVPLPQVTLGPGFHAVTGRNGAGKSTLLRRLAGLRDAGEVVLGGSPPDPGRNTRLLQPDAGDLLMAETVHDELQGTPDPEGLVPLALLGRHPLSLSAGEAHRVALVKALGRPAPVHLLDEPDAHLDADGRWRLLAAIARRLAGGACILAATHDPALIAAAHSRIEVGA